MRLVNVYREAPFDVSTIRRLGSRVNVNLKEKGESDFRNGFSSGRSNVDVNEIMIKQAAVPSVNDRRNIAKLYERVQVSHGNYCSLVKFFGYLNVCATMFLILKILMLHNTESTCRGRIVTRDEIYVHHYGYLLCLKYMTVA